MKNIAILMLLFLTGCSAASTPTPEAVPATSTVPAPSTLTVFAAASLTDAFTELGQAFEAAHPAVTINFNFAGSQVLRTQIVQGAQADVFAPASVRDMTALVASLQVENLAPTQVFATNKMVVVLPESNPAQIISLDQLAEPGVKLVIAAEQVPAGKYARVVLKNLNTEYGEGFNQKVLKNVVSNEENVRQALAKVQLGEADAGIVYMTDALSVPSLVTIDISDAYNSLAEYPIAALKASSNLDLAQVFVEFVLSSEGQTILQKWGFGKP